MSTQLKPYLKEIADKIRDNGENLYQKFSLLSYNTPNENWTVMNYYQDISVNHMANGIKMVAQRGDPYYGCFIKIGTLKECIGKTFTASIDENQNVSIWFGGFDDGTWDVFAINREDVSFVTTTLIQDMIPDYWNNNGWFGLWIVCKQAGTYDINNIVIKDVSPINAKDYPTEIDNVGEAKYNEGHNDGYNSFWEDYIGNGIEKSWTGGKYAFAGQAWNDITFNPTRDIYTTYKGFLNCQSMFSQCYIKDLKGILERNGVKLKTTNAEVFNDFASGALYMTRIPELDMRACNSGSNLFNGCTSLVSIDKIILSTTATQTFTTWFYNCSALKEIRFEGFIRSNISFSSSPLLSYDSMLSIINCLYDFVGNGSTTTCTLTLHADAKARLTSSDIARANEKGWSVA